MLLSLAIRDVVLIERLDLAFQAGLSVLTGETGAGKSILLDALGLALGARADAALVRRAGAREQAQAAVTASFALAPDAPARAVLAALGLDPPEPGEPLILRRALGADGRSRAFINDQPASVGALRALGESLVEIEGQFAAQGLLETANHRAALDDFAGLGGLLAETAARRRAWRAAEAALAEAEAETERARAEEDWLRHVTAELDALDPQPGEEATLAEARALLMHGERLGEGLTAALAEVAEDGGAETRLAAARRILVRLGDKAGGRLDPAIAALDRAADATGEAAALIQSAGAALEADPARLETIEERLFALRALARKHRGSVEELPALRADFAARLAAIDDAGEARARLSREAEAAEAAYVETAERLSAARREAASRLDAAVAAELPPLRLDKAVFRTTVTRLDPAAWTEAGIDRVAFEVATNPGVPPGPLARIASGGELARFMLALKLALGQTGGPPTLVFDEVDAGVGGATAAAVGERLHRLAERRQILVVTHSPQVAARAAQHLRVIKETRAGGRDATTTTAVDTLDEDDRREEIARMLAGARITDEARAAAASLIAGQAR